MKQLRALVIFIVIVLGGIAVVNWWLPSLLKEPSAVRLPPGAKPGSAPTVKEEEIPIAVRTFKAARIEFTDLLPTLGTVRGQSEVDLKFEINGVVRKVLFREGDLVEKGQPLVELDERDAVLRVEYTESKLQAAQAQAKLAEKRMAISENLFKLGAIIKPKFEEAQLEAEQARAQVETARKEADLARAELEKTVLKAPISGVIGTKEVDPGEYVTPQAVVATLMDVRSVFVELGIIERDIERIRLGQRVKVSVDSLPNATLEGKIDNLVPLVEGKSRTLTAKVKIENAGGQLLPGMFARADIAVFEKNNVLVVPTSALKDSDGDGTFDSIFVVDAETARLKPITLGYLTTDYAEIAGGLEESEQVVTEARGALKEGSRVTLLEQEESGVQRAEPPIAKKKEL